MSYQEHLDTLLKRAQAEQKIYETKRKAQADSAAKQIDRLYTDMISAADKDAQLAVSAMERDYRPIPRAPLHRRSGPPLTVPSISARTASPI